MTILGASYHCASRAFRIETLPWKLIDAEVRGGNIQIAEGRVELDEITGIVVDAAVKLHRDLGRNLFESVYEVAVAAMLHRRGLHVERQVIFGFSYEGIEFAQAFRVDLLVEKRVLLELKVVDRLVPAHRTQLLTYLRLANLSVGLLLNFGAPTMKEGIRRLVNDLPPSASSPLRIGRPRGA